MMGKRLTRLGNLNTDYTDLRDISLMLVIDICEIPNICGSISEH